MSVDGMTLASADGSQALGGGARSFSFDPVSVNRLDRIEVNYTTGADQDADAPAGTINLKTKCGFERKGPPPLVAGQRHGQRRPLRMAPQLRPERCAPPKFRPGAIPEYSDVFFRNRLGLLLNLSESSPYVVPSRVDHTYNAATTPTDPRPRVLTNVTAITHPRFTERVTPSLTLDWKATPSLALSLGAMYNSLDAFIDNRTAAFSVPGGRASVTGPGWITSRPTTPRSHSPPTTSTNTRRPARSRPGSHSVAAPGWSTAGCTAPSGPTHTSPSRASARRASPPLRSPASRSSSTAPPSTTPIGQSRRPPAATSATGRASPIRASPTTRVFLSRKSGRARPTSAGTRRGACPRGSSSAPRPPRTTIASATPTPRSPGATTAPAAARREAAPPSRSPTTAGASKTASTSPRSPTRRPCFRTAPGSRRSSVSNPRCSPTSRRRRISTAATSPTRVTSGKRASPASVSPTSASAACSSSPACAGRKTKSRSANSSSAAAVRAAGFVVTPATGRATTVEGLGYPFMSLPKVVRTSAYDNLFPSVSAKLHLSENFQAHLGYSSTVARPALGNRGGVLDFHESTLVANVPNPGLLPERSRNFSGRLAHYFEPVGNLALTLFQNDISDSVTSQQFPASAFGFEDDPLYSTYRFVSTGNRPARPRVCAAAPSNTARRSPSSPACSRASTPPPAPRAPTPAHVAPR